MIVCVFKILDRDGRFFIGQTLDYDQRRKHEQYALQLGQHPNTNLQQYASMYGAASLQWHILKVCRPHELHNHLIEFCAKGHPYYGSDTAMPIVPVPAPAPQPAAPQLHGDPIAAFKLEPVEIPEPEPVKPNKFVPRAVCKIDPKTNKVMATYPSITAAAKANGAWATTISNCCKGKQKMTAGYSWAYATALTI